MIEYRINKKQYNKLYNEYLQYFHNIKSCAYEDFVKDVYNITYDPEYERVSLGTFYFETQEQLTLFLLKL